MKILLLPGLDGTGELFGQFRSQLPDTVTVTVCALPTQGNHDPVAVAEALAATGLVNDENLIVAESFSGPIAYELTKQPHNKIKGVVLVSSFISVPHPLLRLAQWLPLRFFPWHWMPVWALRWFAVGAGASDQLIRHVQSTIASVPTSVIAARVAALSRLKEPSEKIRIPCLYLQPSNDRLVPKWHTERLRALCYDLTVRVIPGPHFLLQANPGGCVEPVMAFIDLIARSGTGSPPVGAPGGRRS